MQDDQVPNRATRRRFLKFIAGASTFAAVSGATPRRSYDDAVLFLDQRFMAGISDLVGADDRKASALLGSVTHYAQAMALLPANDPQAIEAKLRAASWSLDRGYYRLCLSAELSTDLAASAADDQGKAV